MAFDRHWRIFFFTIFCSSALSCQKFRQNLSISGSITLTGESANKIEQSEESLFILLKDSGGVPIAVKRIVNPQFPIFYSLGPDDLLIPSLRPRFPLMVEAELNLKGKIGPPELGDFSGVYPYSVGPRQKGVSIVMSRVSQRQAKTRN